MKFTLETVPEVITVLIVTINTIIFGHNSTINFFWETFRCFAPILVLSSLWPQLDVLVNEELSETIWIPHNSSNEFKFVRMKLYTDYIFGLNSHVGGRNWRATYRNFTFLVHLRYSIVTVLRYLVTLSETTLRTKTFLETMKHISARFSLIRLVQRVEVSMYYLCNRRWNSIQYLFFTFYLGVNNIWISSTRLNIAAKILTENFIPSNVNWDPENVEKFLTLHFETDAQSSRKYSSIGETLWRTLSSGYIQWQEERTVEVIQREVRVVSTYTPSTMCNQITSSVFTFVPLMKIKNVKNVDEILPCYVCHLRGRLAPQPIWF